MTAAQLGFAFGAAPVDLRGEVATALNAEVAEVGEAVDETGAVADAPLVAERFLEALRVLGLAHVRTLVLTRNRSTVVGLKGFELRVHEGFVGAPQAVHAEIVRFVMARRRWERDAARRAILSFALPAPTQPPKAPERTHPEDEAVAERLAEWHTRLNGERFGAALRSVPIRISRRMVHRLGHYAPGRDGVAPEIAIGARHVRRDGLAAAIETLLHEMVHQWQHESGLPIDHGLDFRRKCREVGAVPRAKRKA